MQLWGDIIQEEVWNVCKVYFVGRLCRSVSSVKVSQSVYIDIQVVRPRAIENAWYEMN